MHSLLTVSTPASVTALTTLDRVKAELEISGTSSDVLLAAKIAEASSDIVAHLDRRLARETVTEMFWGFRVNPEALILDRYPVVSIGSVTLDAVVLDTSASRIDVDAGLLYRLADDGAPSKWCAGKQVEVAYTGGFLMPGQAGRDLPEALEAAAIELVQSFWTARGRDPLIRAEDVPGVGRTEYWVGAVGAKGKLLPGVESKIEPFKRGLEVA